MELYRLLVSCPDQPGIIHEVSRLLFEAGANIFHSDQHTSDPTGGDFFLRMEFAAPADAIEDLQASFTTVAGRFAMDWRIFAATTPKRLAIFVSKSDHCLLDLLWRIRRKELNATAELVISNHEDSRADVEAFGIEYHHVPMTRDHKPEAERRMLDLVKGRADLAVLARYMQVLTSGFLEEVGMPVINVHHSLLPAFPGAGPYERARERGVKVIGATAHYVTEELDAGPIIEQDLTHVSHRDDLAALKLRGATIERDVLSRAVTWHCEDRVVRHGNTTVVF